MRKLHRWTSGACMVLLAWVSITGTLLSLDELLPPPGVGAGPPGPGAGPSAGPGLAIDAAAAGWRLPAHNLLKELHTGSFAGLSGRTVDVATGAAFAFLAVSGLVMYLQMLAARRAHGRRGWFWG